MKFLLIGNHTCGNRGDAAILRGLMAGLEDRYPGAFFEVTSRYPVSSSWLLGHACRDDVFRRWHIRSHGRLEGIVYRLYGRFLPYMMALALSLSVLEKLLPAVFRAEIERMRGFDAVIQVGGSFFVDLYGAAQLEGPLAALLAGKPLYLVGHSMGPFGGRAYRWLISRMMRGAQCTTVREPASFELMEQAALLGSRVRRGADTAWLVAPVSAELPATGWWAARDESRLLVAITVRELAPFDSRLGVSQQQYEHAFELLIRRLVNEGCDVVVVSTCTGIDGYHRDDRMNGLSIFTLMEKSSHMHVVMEELTDVELGGLINRCDLMIGTRLHSVIIAMNFGTPAIAINYEHKSAGVLAQLGLPELACDISALLSGELAEKAVAMLSDVSGWRQRIAAAVEMERARARESLSCIRTNGQ